MTAAASRCDLCRQLSQRLQSRSTGRRLSRTRTTTRAARDSFLQCGGRGLSELTRISLPQAAWRRHRAGAGPTRSKGGHGGRAGGPRPAARHIKQGAKQGAHSGRIGRNGECSLHLGHSEVIEIGCDLVIGPIL